VKQIILMTMALVGLVAKGAIAGALSIATGAYAPFTDPDAPDHGIVNNQVLRMAETAGYDVQFHYLPWKRGLELTRSGEFAGASFWYYDAARETDFIHVGPILEDRIVFFHMADRTDLPKEWASLRDLAGLRIGAVTGYTMTPEFWELGDAGVLDIHLAPDDLSNFRKLRAGRIDLFPISAAAGRHLVEEHFPAEIQDSFITLSQPLSKTEAYLLISRAVPDADAIAARLTNALVSLRAKSSEESQTRTGSDR